MDDKKRVVLAREKSAREEEGARPSLSCASRIIFLTFRCVPATQSAWP